MSAAVVVDRGKKAGADAALGRAPGERKVVMGRAPFSAGRLVEADAMVARRAAFVAEVAIL